MKKQLYTLALAAIAATAAITATAQTGNFGIGTVTPGTKLDVNGAITNRETAVAVASNAATVPANVSQVRLTGTATATVVITAPAAPNSGQRLIIYNNTTGGFDATLNGYTVSNGYAVEFIYSNGGWRTTDNGLSVGAANGKFWGLTGNSGTNPATNFLGTTDNQAQAFRTNNTEKMRIGANGFLGIGTTNTTTRLHVVNDAGGNAGDDYVFEDFRNGTGITNGMIQRAANGTEAAPANLTNGMQLGMFGFGAYANGVFTNNDQNGMSSYYKGDGTTNLVDLRFTTTGLERMRIDETGNVGINTTAPTAGLHIKDHHIRIQQTTAPTVAVTAANGITGAAVTSGGADARGNVTTTGTNSAAANTVLTITFNGTYTVAPVVVVNATNESGRTATWYVTSTTTGFTINIRGGGANPSFNYMTME